MEKEIGVVKSIENNEVKIEFVRSSACESCGACMMASDTSKMHINVPYKRDVEVGDRVYIDVNRNFYILSSVLLYIIPLIIVLVVVFLGNRFISEDAQVITAILAAGLAFGFYFLLKVFKEKFFKMKQHNITYYKVT
jgi:sigma-E factor negative regulatory protein RseC